MKNIYYNARISETDQEKMNYLTEKLKVNKSELLKKMIHLFYLKEKEEKEIELRRKEELYLEIHAICATCLLLLKERNPTLDILKMVRDMQTIVDQRTFDTLSNMSFK